MAEVASELTFESSEFEAAFDEAAANCNVLTRKEAEHFVTKGYVLIKDAFSKAHAEEVCESAWQELEREHKVDRTKPDTWASNRSGWGPAGYSRLQGAGKRYKLKSVAPRAYFAQTDLIGGAQRLHNEDEQLVWGDGVVSNLGIEGDSRWEPPAPRQGGWHKDGWHFRHFLNSPEQALVTVPLYTDIQPQSGGTFLAIDSIKPVAHLLRDTPAGLHPDSVQGGGFLIPGLIEQCETFTELTGEAGDMVLLHPYMMHRVSINPSNRPRFIANMAPVLKEPMQFDRAQGEGYSLAELTVLNALGESSYAFRQKREMKAFKPGPFRDDEERETQRTLLQKEMQEFAERGVVSPDWAEEFGYMSNSQFNTN